jgi:ketosteroid isomerase-like protein
VTGDDRFAIQTGQWHATVPGDGGSSLSGHLLNVFERQSDGTWKLQAQMWTPGR